MTKSIYRISVLVSENGVSIQENEYPVLAETEKTISIESGTLKKNNLGLIDTSLREDMFKLSSYVAYTESIEKIPWLLDQMLKKIDDKMKKMAEILALYESSKLNFDKNGLEPYIVKKKYDL